MLRATLLKLSESKRLAHWVTSNSPTRRMSHRFVAGETLDEALAAARACNATGMLAILDYLGENVSTVTDAQRARDTYLEIFEQRRHRNACARKNRHAAHNLRIDRYRNVFGKRHHNLMILT